MIVYLVTNTINGKIYVGKTIGSLDLRWKRHCNAAKRPKPPMHLSCAIRKYGPDAFRVEQIATAESEAELNGLERKYIQEYQSHLSRIGYNHTLGGDGFSIGNTIRVGKKLSAKHKARISATNKYPRTPEMRAHMRAAQQNRKPITEATRLKMSAAGKGRLHGPMPDAQKEKLRQVNLNRTWKYSAEALEAMSRAQRGKVIPREQVERVRAALRGKPRPPEVREKIRLAQVGKAKPEIQRIHMSEGHKGLKATPEHRQHMSDSHRARLAAMTPEQRCERMKAVWVARRRNLAMTPTTIAGIRSMVR